MLSMLYTIELIRRRCGVMLHDRDQEWLLRKEKLCDRE